MPRHSPDRVGQVVAAGHQEEHLRVDLGDRVPAGLARRLTVRTEQVPAAGAADLLGHPVTRPRRAGRATRGRRPAAIAGRRRAAPRRAARSPRAARAATRRGRSALSSASVIAPDRRDRVEDPLDRRRLERHDRDVGVDRPRDLVDLAVADRADAAQLLGQDQVRARASARATSSRAYSDDPPCTAALTRRWMSRDEASVRSWTLRVMTGLATTSGGQSHSWVTPTSSSPRPRAQTISVADGQQGNDAHRGSGQAGRAPGLRRPAVATSSGLASSTMARAAALSVYQVASITV